MNLSIGEKIIVAIIMIIFFILCFRYEDLYADRESTFRKAFDGFAGLALGAWIAIFIVWGVHYIWKAIM